jgi:hypothetical protein
VNYHHSILPLPAQQPAGHTAISDFLDSPE